MISGMTAVTMMKKYHASQSISIFLLYLQKINVALQNKSVYLNIKFSWTFDANYFCWRLVCERRKRIARGFDVRRIVLKIRLNLLHVRRQIVGPDGRRRR